MSGSLGCIALHSNLSHERPRQMHPYVSNSDPHRSVSAGLDVQVFFAEALYQLECATDDPEDREHVTYYVLNERPDLFGIHSVTDTENNSDLRWTVDVAEDLEMVRRLYEELALGDRFVGYRELLAYVRAHPAVAVVNAGVMQKKAG